MVFFAYIWPVTKAERTRNFIIEQTAPLFNKKGYDGTSLQDMLDSTNLTKGSLYGNFSGKEEIATEAFRYSVKKVQRMMKERLGQVSTCKGKLLSMVEFFAEYVMDPPVEGGCPMLNTAIEADDHRTSMRRAVTAELNQTVDFIESLLKKGIRNGEFKPGFNPRKVAYIFFCSIEGALMFARAERSPEPMDIIVGHCKDILKQISK
jgi:TetR/AcrR family transcriptional repressor of nem operon